MYLLGVRVPGVGWLNEIPILVNYLLENISISFLRRVSALAIKFAALSSSYRIVYKPNAHISTTSYQSQGCIDLHADSIQQLKLLYGVHVMQKYD